MKPLIVVFLLVLLAPQCCFCQEITAAPVLLISPNASANGMGEVSAAILTEDPMAVLSNPAHIGMQAFSHYFTSGYNYFAGPSQFSLIDQRYRSYSANVGISLCKIADSNSFINLGVGYSNIHLTEEIHFVLPDQEIVATIDRNDNSDQFTIGLGINTVIKASVGFSYKHINSALGPLWLQGQDGRFVAGTGDAYDWGLLADIPVMSLLAREGILSNAPSLFSPYFDLTSGISINNLGNNNMIYIALTEPAPVPRYARVGMGFDLGLKFTNNMPSWKPLSFKWSVEANDLLVKRYNSDTLGFGDQGQAILSYPHWGYKNGFGSIQFFNQVIAGHSNQETITKNGWEINLGEIFYLRGGRYEAGPRFGTGSYGTKGYGIRFAGVMKLIQFLNPECLQNSASSFFLRHIDVQYMHSELTADDPANPLNGRTFTGAVVNLAN